MQKGCKGLTGLLLGHDFHPRYSLGPATIGPVKSLPILFADDVAVIMEASKQKTYRGDVCSRCGLVVNNQDKE